MKQSVEYSNVIILNSSQDAFILRGGMILRYVRCETSEMDQSVAHPLALSPAAK
jgi:hypothetical protein